jgi:hypothetical protein
VKSKTAWFFALLLGIFSSPPSGAKAEDQQFTVSLDFRLAGAFAPAGGPAFAGGLGAAAFGDWRPVPFLALGTGLDFMEYPGGGWQTSSWSLGGRLFPLPMEKTGEWYLQGSGGLDFITQSLSHRWPGNGHLAAGPGYRLFMGKGTALDLGLQYDFFTPVHSPLQALGPKVGWTWLFGKVPTPPPSVWVSPLLSAPATVESGPVTSDSAPVTGDSAPVTVGKKRKKHRPAPTPTPVPDPYLR